MLNAQSEKKKNKLMHKGTYQKEIYHLEFHYYYYYYSPGTGSHCFTSCTWSMTADTWICYMGARKEARDQGYPLMFLICPKGSLPSAHRDASEQRPSSFTH